MQVGSWFLNTSSLKKSLTKSAPTSLRTTSGPDNTQNVPDNDIHVMTHPTKANREKIINKKTPENARKDRRFFAPSVENLAFHFEKTSVGLALSEYIFFDSVD